ncbi:hypothetical protein UJ101_01901 [Flavobacteriaceae bacterium UJ101]|nr:hypothetical protein UJ101_01901 [Flavobacteriaceae bacterium UJ101]
MKSLKQLLLVLFPVLFFSQEIEPDFIKEIHKEVPNLRISDSLFNRYKEKKEGKPLGYYTIYSKEKGFISYWHSEYHHWRKEHLQYVTADGSVIIPTSKEIEIEFKKESQQRILVKNEREALKKAVSRKSAVTSVSTTTWSYLGPKNQYTIGGDKLNTQVNVQAFDQSLTNRDLLYCAPEGGGLYKSNDRGLTWSVANPDYNMSSSQFIKIHPDDDDKVIAATTGGVIYSTIDGGTTWRSVSLPSNLSGVSGHNVYAISTMEIIPKEGTNPARVFILGKNGMFNYDFDTNTVSVSTELNIRGSEIKKSPSNSNTIYLLGLNETTLIEELYVSIDRGSTWVKKASNGYITVPTGQTKIVNSRGGRIGLTPADPNRVYVYLIGEYVSGDPGGFLTFMKSEDGGENWVITDPLGPGKGGVNYEKNNFTTTKSHVALSAAGNGTYHQGYYNSGLLVDQFDADKVIAGGVTSHKTVDGGLNWSMVSNGYIASNGTRIHSDFQFGLSNKFGAEQDNWICNDGGIVYSTSFFGSIGTDKVDTRTTYLPTDFWGFDVGLFNKNLTGGRYHNGDAAMTSAYNGDFIYVGGAETDTGLVLFGSEEREMMWRDATDRVIPSTLGGSDGQSKSNSSYYPGGHRSSYTRPMFDKTLTGTFYFGIGKKVIKFSQDKKGIELHEFENELTNVASCATNENYIYTIMQGKAGYSPWDRDAVNLFRSTDGGLNWEKVYEFPNNSTNWRGYNIFVDNKNPLRIWAHAKLNKSFYVSEDGGETFTSLTDTPAGAYNMVYQWSSNNIYAATKGGAYRYDIENNTWHEYGDGIPAGLIPHRLQATYGEKKVILSSGGYGVWEADFYSESDDYPVYATLQSDIIVGYDKTDDFSITYDIYGDVSKYDTIITTNSSKAVIKNLDNGIHNIEFNDYGIFDVVLKLTDKTTGEVQQETTKKFYIYPGCSFDDDENEILIPMDNVAVWFSGDDLYQSYTLQGGSNSVYDKYDLNYYISGYCDPITFNKYNNTEHRSLYFDGTYNCRMNFSKRYTEGKTFFWVINETPGIGNQIRNLLGDDTAIDFHAGATNNKKILRSQAVVKFDLTKMNGAVIDATTTDRPTTPSVIGFRVKDTESVAFSNFSKDRGFTSRLWKGDLAELIIYNRRLTDEEFQKVEQYLIKKYKINN